MFDRCLNILLDALLLAFFLPLLTWYFLAAKLASVHSRSNASELYKISLLKQQIAGEFRFESAIGAYEALIDSTLAEGRR